MEFATKRISVDVSKNACTSFTSLDFHLMSVPNFQQGKYLARKRAPAKIAEVLLPDLEYSAPELVQSSGEQHCTAAADMFSLGLTVCAFYNHGQSLIDVQQVQQNDVRAYKAELQKVKQNP